MHGMVRLPIPKTTYNPIFPPTLPNFLSKKHQCLALLKLSSSLNHLTQIHAQIQLSGLQHDSFLLTQLIRFCSLSSPSKHLSYAKSLLFLSFNPLPVSSWNTLIRGYSSSDTPKEAIWVFLEMLKQGAIPNKLTFPFLFKACAVCLALQEGKQLHAGVLKYGLDGDVYVNNNLVHFYGSCKKIFYSRKVFDKMPERTVVSWNAVITACVDNLWFGSGIRYFLRLMDDGFEPDETTMVLVLSVCAEVGNLSLGSWVHSQVIGKGMELNYKLGTALVDMYAKSGEVDYARRVFDKMEERNVWTWSAMILGLAQHGFAEEGLDLFVEMMKSSSVNPNYVTFLGVLCACSHAGLVEDGFRYFHEMEHKHGIKPMMVHYGAVVDILGRAGRLKMAYDFVTNLPLQSDPILWRTLLSACSIHNDKSDTECVTDMVKKKLFELEPRRSGNFVMVANIYAESGKYEEAEILRRVMRNGGLKTRGGESCVELGGSTHRFFSGSNPQVEQEGICQLLDELSSHMKLVNFF